MPIYEYECHGCGHQFEQLVLRDTVPECPECHGHDLERILSQFAVSSDAIRQTNLQRAKQRVAQSSARRDKLHADHEQVREHLQDDYGVDIGKKKES